MENAVTPRLLDLRRAAAYLGAGVSVWTVRDLVWAGELASVKLGRKLFIDRADLDALVDRLKCFEGAERVGANAGQGGRNSLIIKGKEWERRLANGRAAPRKSRAA